MPDVESSWTVVVPTKRAEIAKSRLEPALGPWRARLARAFALDTVAAAGACALVDRIVVVSDGLGLGSDLTADLTASGAYVVADPSHGRDMNAAIMAGVQAARTSGRRPVAVLTADLPALQPGELAAALHRAANQRLSAVSDSEGIGTTMLASTRPGQLTPRFGHGSFARHLRDGARPVAGGPGLVRDVDLPQHLDQVVALGVGPRTAALIDEAGLA